MDSWTGVLAFLLHEILMIPNPFFQEAFFSLHLRLSDAIVSFSSTRNLEGRVIPLPHLVPRLPKSYLVHFMLINCEVLMLPNLNRVTTLLPISEVEYRWHGHPANGLGRYRCSITWCWRSATCGKRMKQVQTNIGQQTWFFVVSISKTQKGAGVKKKFLT